MGDGESLSVASKRRPDHGQDRCSQGTAPALPMVKAGDLVMTIASAKTLDEAA